MIMSILKILARTAILLVVSIIQVIGVLTEGFMRLLAQISEYLVELDDLVEKPGAKTVKAVITK